MSSPMSSKRGAGVAASDATVLTDVITQLRRVLRRSIRTDYPWERWTMAQVEVLQTLDESGPIRINELAERLRLAQSTVSTLLGTLTTAKLVLRQSDPADRRASVVELTPDGRRDLSEWLAAHQRRIGSALGRLDAADRAAVLAALPALGRLVDALRSQS